LITVTRITQFYINWLSWGKVLGAWYLERSMLTFRVLIFFVLNQFWVFPKEGKKAKEFK